MVVRPRRQGRRDLLADRIEAERVIAAGEDDAFDAGQPGGLEHVEQAARVDAEKILQRVGADHAGEMHDRLHAAHHVFDGGRSAMSVTTSSSLLPRSFTGRMSVRRRWRQWLRRPARSAVPMAPAAPVMQDAIGLGVDHGHPSAAYLAVTRQMTLPTSSAISRDRRSWPSVTPTGLPCDSFSSADRKPERMSRGGLQAGRWRTGCAPACSR